MNIKVEPGEEIKKQKCEHCGRTMMVLHGFIYENNQPLAVYFATLFPKEHKYKLVELAIGIGEWDDTDDWGKNISMNFHIRPTQKEFQMAITDKEISGYKNSKLLGRMFNRKEALVHPLKDKFFHIADHIVLDDRRINHYLEEN